MFHKEGVIIGTSPEPHHCGGRHAARPGHSRRTMSLVTSRMPYAVSARAASNRTSRARASSVVGVSTRLRTSRRSRPAVPTSAVATDKPASDRPSLTKIIEKPPALLSRGERTAAVPYYDGAVDRPVLINDAAREAIASSAAKDFIALPTREDPALVRLRDVLEKGWRVMEPTGSGHAGLWPELFEAGADLIKSQFPQFGDDDAMEVLTGTGWLDPSLESDAIDWVMRRPEGHVVSSKIHFATRLHRDPDSWTNPKTPQRPKDGWTDLAMPDRDRYQYRFVNIWIARSAIDPTGQVWQSPLVVCLPRDGGEREWKFEKRKISMDDTEAEKEYNVRGITLNPKTWIPGTNRLLRPLWQGGAGDAKASGKSTSGDGFGGGEEELTAEEIAKFEFPELTSEDAHSFVTGPAMVFDSFDLWHGAARWEEDKAFTDELRRIDVKGRQPFHRARCSIEMRFRVRIDMKADGAAKQWGPFASAVASGKFRDDGLRDSEAKYDLAKGVVAK